jgi:hypothetical protein
MSGEIRNRKEEYLDGRLPGIVPGYHAAFLEYQAHQQGEEE